MYPILFSIGPLSFHSYGLFVALSFLVTIWIFYLLAKRKKLWEENIFERMIFVLIFVIVFARLAFFIAYYHDYYSHWYEFFYIWQGGLVSYGGILGMILGFILFFRKNLLRYLDILAVSVLAGGIFWRIGGILAGSYETLSNFPSVWLEILFLAIGFGLFYFLYNKKILTSGKVFFLVLIYYGIIRLILDYWREYSHSLIDLNIGQWFGIVLIAMGAIGMIYFNPKKDLLD
jgi:phosphatidylglycerol:prolipoprotein diacylglycerol transferase